MSRPFTVFNPATGEILRTGWTSSGRLQSQCKAGQAVLEEEARDTEHFVVDGAIVPRPVLQLSAKRGQLVSVPTGTKVMAEGATQQEVRGTLTIPTPKAGPVDLIPPFPYRRMKL